MTTMTRPATTRPTYHAIDIAALYDEAQQSDPRSHRLLSRAEEAACALAYAAGDERGRVVLVLMNQRLVYSQAAKFSRSAAQTLPFEDMVQEGTIGLMRAVEKFEAQRGHKFSTYALAWVQQTISRAIIQKQPMISLPVQASDKLIRLRVERSRCGIEDYDQLVDRLRWSKHDRERFRDLYAGYRFTSLDAPLTAESDDTLMDVISAPNIDTGVLAEEALLAYERQRQLAAIVEQAGLNEREYMVIGLRYGLVDGEVKTLDQVGSHLGVTRERVRQLELKIMARLREAALSHQSAKELL